MGILKELAIEAIQSGRQRIDRQNLGTLPFLAPLISMEAPLEQPKRSMKPLPVVLRPLTEETLHSWLSRVAAVCRMRRWINFLSLRCHLCTA